MRYAKKWSLCVEKNHDGCLYHTFTGLIPNPHNMMNYLLLLLA